ncbi:hypothetical protein CYMTET_8815 [Cymbomonas tetramitiformis]|uniref:Protein kinase domain-containing protein n=1 Tax=Cymbomonas tetramitiformis TaxID=36881 RepID=A0AAE0LG45_9CHLO|nr:hypothetical protein CYMTET_8815 [Cymbomonas tetramitiformis]
MLCLGPDPCARWGACVNQVNEKVCLEHAQVPNSEGWCECKYGYVSSSAGCVEESDDSKDSTMIIWICVVAAVAVLVIAALVAYRSYLTARQNNSWKVPLSELQLDEPPVVLGRGTYGMVLLGEFRSTQVAVKRVLPKNLQDNYKSMEIFGPSKSFLAGQREKQLRVNDMQVQAQSGETKRGRNFSTVSNTSDSAGSRDGKLVRSLSTASNTSDSAGSRDGKRSRGISIMTQERKPSMILRERVVSDSHIENQDVKMHKKLVTQFYKEMQIMMFLRHPNIVTVMGAVVEKKEEPLLLMEHMRNGSLHDLLHNPSMQFDEEMIMRILLGIVNGMKFLHSAEPPVLHNDLKSGNVLIGESFEAKIADFGLSMKKKSSGFLGTPYWMAPELFEEVCPPPPLPFYERRGC